MTAAYNAGLGNAKGTWDLLKEIFDCFGPCLSSRVEKHTALTSLSESTGEWAKHAKDSHGRWQQPILTKAALESHLRLQNGVLQPLEECTASFAWAKLLYALRIRPGDNILKWRPSSQENDPVKTGTISLAIEGHALCHIINLYRRYTTSSIDRINEYRFPFGILEATDDARRVFTFETGPQAASEVSEPFQYIFQDVTGRREGHLKPKDGTTFECYLRALNFGGSDPAIYLETGKKAPQDRGRSLLRAFDLLVKKDSEEDLEKDWEKPYLVTPTWIEQANTITRRLTTDGGQNNDLVDHICKYISADSEGVKTIRLRLPENAPWREDLRTTVKGFCMFDVDSFEFIWDIDTLNRSEKNTIKGIVQELLPMTVAKLSEKEESSWVQNLSKIITAEEMVRLLNLPRQVVNRPIIVLKEELKDWENLAEIRG